MKSLPVAFPGWDIGVITSHTGFEAAFGIKADTVKQFKSGNLDTQFHIFSGKPREDRTSSAGRN
jgi:23S rRNA G2445 N2-methylase RlmL